MPIFEYNCSKCETNFEKLVKRDDPVPPCPTCEQDVTVTKQEISKSSFALKGGGWYKNGCN